MTQSTWRAHANKVIAQVVTDNPDLPEPELRKKISEAYPFGQRQYHPYKIWLSAVKQYFAPMGAKNTVTTRRRKQEQQQAGQLGLLEGA